MAPGSDATWQIEHDGSVAVLRLSGHWLVGESGLCPVADVQEILARLGDCAQLRFDTTALLRWDSALVVFVRMLHRSADAAQRTLKVELTGLPPPLQRLLVLADADHGQAGTEGAEVPWSELSWIKVWLHIWWTNAAGSMELVGAGVCSIVPALRGRLHTRLVELIALMQESGAEALGIVTIVNALVGAILAFVGAVQLQRFGAGTYVANLVGVAVTREMAPIMTAIVMAGRTGGAYAAQIATMEENEEIDALLTFGIPPVEYLVVPRHAALITMMPLLYFYGCLFGVIGGLVVSVAMLSMSPTTFLEQVRAAVLPTEFYIGLTKSICFGTFIALVGCRVGLNAGRSAAEVGRAATGAVVASIIGIIVLDAIFAACTNVLGI